jgi:hypothetical protein
MAVTLRDAGEVGVAAYAAARERGVRHLDLCVDLADGRRVSFQAAAPGTAAETCFILGIRKCGSSIMNSMVADLARVNHRHFMDVAGRFFEANVPERTWRVDPAARTLLVAGQVHGGFRAMPLAFARHPLYENARKILLVRDPRDALVSEYFSNAYSHSVPEHGTEHAGGENAAEDMLALRRAALQASIEAYVVRQAPALNRTFMDYEDAAADPNTKIFRYETVILAKRQWVRDIARHFGWPLPDDNLLDGMMGWADVVPEDEQPERFIRKVWPGDHKVKLGPDVVDRLNDILAPAMRLFAYV